MKNMFVMGQKKKKKIKRTINTRLWNIFILSWEHLKIVGYFWYRNLSQNIIASHCPPGCPFLPWGSTPTRFTSSCRVYTTSPCAEHYMGHPLLILCLWQGVWCWGMVVHTPPKPGERWWRDQDDKKTTQLGPQVQINSVSNWTSLGKENSPIFWIYCVRKFQDLPVIPVNPSFSQTHSKPLTKCLW